MSFNIILLLAVPRREDVSTIFAGGEDIRKVWRIESVLDLSALRLSPKEKEFKYLDMKYRAKTYFLDMLWPALSRRLDEGQLEFAPKFVVYEDDLRKYPEKFPSELVSPHKEVGGFPVPGRRNMEWHNQVLLKEERPKNFEDIKMGEGFPFLWFDCQEIALMLMDAKPNPGLSKDKEALAFCHIWRTEISDFASIGGKVIMLLSAAALPLL